MHRYSMSFHFNVCISQYPLKLNTIKNGGHFIMASISSMSVPTVATLIPLDTI